MALKAAFIFVAPEADPARHHTEIETPQVTLATIGVRDYQAAAQVARELVQSGYVAIELCGGFGIDIVIDGDAANDMRIVDWKIQKQYKTRWELVDEMEASE